MPIVEVVAAAAAPMGTPGDRVQTLALLNTCSNRTYCTRLLARMLQLKGRAMDISFGFLGHVTRTKVQEIDLSVRSINGSEALPMTLKDVLVVPALPEWITAHAAGTEDKKRWDHLKEKRVIARYPNGVNFLIGNDHPRATRPVEVS